LFGEGVPLLVGGSKLAFEEIDTAVEMVAHLNGFSQAFLRVTLKSKSVKQRLHAVA
jgi:ABC-type molybdate transport system permease subunit